MELLIPIVFIATLALFLNLRGRVKKLEQFIKGGESQRTTEPNYQVQIQQPVETQQPTITPVPVVDYIQQQLKRGISIEEVKSSLIANGWQAPDIQEAFSSVVLSVPLSESASGFLEIGPTWFDKFSEWIKEDWLMKLGALLLLIGFGWLTTYAFLNNWIGPMGRIALGIIAGALFLLLGWWRIKNYIHQGGIFLIIGSTTILLTIFAAREIYDFFTPLSALAVMFLSTAFVALASVKYNSRSLALASLILAGIAPLLTNSPLPDYISLFLYLFVVVIGAIWITVFTGRRELTTAALILITFYSLPHLLSPIFSDTDTLLLFAYAFTALFFVTNTVGILKLKSKEIIPDLVTAAGNGLFILSWIMVAAPDNWQSLIISIWMVMFAAGAFFIFKVTQKREPFYVYAGVGVGMLAAATSAELQGATLTIAYTIESGIIALIAYSVLRDIKIAERMSLLLTVPVILSFGSIVSSAWATNIIHKDFFVLLVLGLTFLGLGLFFLHGAREVENEKSQYFNAALLMIGSIYVYALLWLSLQAGLENDNTAIMVSLVVYTVIGLVCYFYGLTNEKKGLRFYGGALIGFVVGRLFLVDVWNMELTGRIVTFFLIGALLVSTAFLKKKKRDSNLPNNSK